MKVQFASSFKVQVEATAEKMVEENLDVCDIPEGLGMVLARIGSTEFQSRRDSDPPVIMVPKVVSVGSHGFIVCVR